MARDTRIGLSPIPLVLGSVGMGLQAGSYISRTQKGIYFEVYIIVVPLERREGKHARSSQENKWDHHVFQVSTETSPSVPVENPKIQLHKYNDTEYESILKRPPALCSVNELTALLKKISIQPSRSNRHQLE